MSSREEEMRREVSPGQALKHFSSEGKIDFILWLSESGLVLRFYMDSDGMSDEIYWEEQALGTVSTWGVKHRCWKSVGGAYCMYPGHHVPEEIDKFLRVDKLTDEAIAEEGETK